MSTGDLEQIWLITGMKEAVRGLHGCSTGRVGSTVEYSVQNEDAKHAVGLQIDLINFVKRILVHAAEFQCNLKMMHLGACALMHYGEQSYLFGLEKLFHACSGHFM